MDRRPPAPPFVTRPTSVRASAWARAALTALLAAAATACGSSAPFSDGGALADGPAPGDGGLAADDLAHPGSDGASGGDLAQGGTTTTIRVHYPAGSHTLAVRGALAPLAWTKGQPMAAGADDTYVFTTTALAATSEWKPLLDDSEASWALGPNYHVSPGQTVDVYPRFQTGAGKVVKLLSKFHSKSLAADRDVWAYLPASYDENPRARFPVLYFHDGQNLFDDTCCYGGWKVDHTLDRFAAHGTCDVDARVQCDNDGDCKAAGGLCTTPREAIVIGVANTNDRIYEYTPTKDAQYGGGGGDLYLTLLAAELKPVVDKMLRTRPGREDTGTVGSSLGGLISAYAGVKRPDVFGLLGELSPSTWWDKTYILGALAGAKGKQPRPLRVYVDSGDSGDSNDDVVNTQKLAAEYAAQGYTEGQDLHYVVQKGGMHNEGFWAQRVPGALKFLLGPR